MKNNKKEFVLFGLGLLGLIIITVGVTYAFFNYTQEGVKENSITTGSITFLYTENTNIGNGISIEEAYPMSDDDGKVLAGNGQVFDFKVTSSTGSFSVGYEITARMESDSTLADSAVKLYLTKVAGLAEEEIVLAKYSELTQTTKVDSTKYNEKTLYTGEIPANQKDYEDTFRLRMWIADDIDFSNGNYNGKSFTLRVNVYANADSNENTNNYIAYSIGDSITLSDGSKWHVLEESSENNPNVVLLSDYNLNSDGSYSTECRKVCNSMAFDSDNTNIYDETDNNNIGYFIKNTYEPLITTVLPGTTNVTLPTANQIAAIESVEYTEENIKMVTEWLLNQHYWTKTAQNSSSSNVRGIFGSGGGSLMHAGYSANIASSLGARPVITTSKSNIVKTMTSETALLVGTQVTAIDGSRWHVLEASAGGVETVTLLSDYNLNSDGTYNIECGYDINSTYACSPMAFDSDNTNTYDETDSNNIGYFIKNTYAPLVSGALPGTTNITLPTAYQIANSNNMTFSQTTLFGLTNTWGLTTNYWTKTARDSSVHIWIVVGGASAIDGNDPRYSEYYGARPVITTPKSNLLAE